METACLRIRFTPLLKDIQKEDSKHFVEIVPEISCVQNLDKIQWTNEEDSIEYTIPMTYKIILRKKEIRKETLENVQILDKTYHSCVDLLITSSDTNLMKNGSGDINRIVSDTFVLTKVTADVERCSILLKEIKNVNVIDSIELTTAQVQTEVHSNPSISSQLIYNEVIDNRKTRASAVTQTSAEVVQNESLVQVSKSDIFDQIKESINKITNTEGCAFAPNDVAVETGTRMVTIDNKTETKCRLSLTPVCAINTDEELSRPRVTRGSNTIVFRLYETHNPFASGLINYKNILDRDFCDVNSIHFEPTSNTTKQYGRLDNHRILPEVRVAKFVQLMEKEIMPLKLMLGDILDQCSSLGLCWNKSKQNPLLYKNVNNTENQITRCLKTRKESKSNRVVYSIVFNG